MGYLDDLLRKIKQATLTSPKLNFVDRANQGIQRRVIQPIRTQPQNILPNLATNAIRRMPAFQATQRIAPQYTQNITAGAGKLLGGIPQQILRAGPALQMGLNKTAPKTYTPTTWSDKFMYGTDPIKSGDTSYFAEVAKNKGVDPRLAGKIGMGATIAGLVSDVVPGGSGKSKIGKGLLKIVPDDKRVMAQYIDAVRLGKGVDKSLANQADAIANGYKLINKNNANRGLAEIFDNTLQKTADAGRKFIRNKQNNRYKGSTTFKNYVPGESIKYSGAMAGFETYQDEDGRTKVRFNPQKAAIGLGAGVVGGKVASKFSRKNLTGQALGKSNEFLKKTFENANSIPENISSEDIKDIQNLSKFQTDSKAFEPIFNKWIGLRDSAKTKATQVADSVNNVSKDLHTKIIKGLEGGEVSPEVSKTVNLFRKKYDELYKVAKESGIDINYLKNYVTHIWKQSPEEVTQAYRVAKKKFNFANERTVPTYEEGIKMGLEPKFTNPAQIIGEYTRKLEQTKANIGMLNELKDSGVVVPASVGSRTPGFKPIIASGLPKNFSQIDSDMGVIGDYYAPAEVADKINKIFSPETPDTIGKIANIGAKISGGAQDILLSGGIPKTPINAFTLAQTTKEVLAGRVKSPLMSMVKSLSGKSSDTFFKDNAKQIIKMQERNVPIQTSFDYNKMGDVIGAKNKLGNVWHKIVNEPTFKRFMPMLQVNLFNDVESSLLKAGKTKKEAADIAAKAVSNFYGLTNTGKTAQRSQLGKDVVSATLFAPRYRESMVNFWINNIKAMKNPLAPENKANTIFNIGALATIYGMNEANKALNGQNMWENPEGKKDKLLIPMGDKTLGIPFLSSIATIPRMAANTAYDVATGDFKAAGKELKSNVSMAFRPIGDVLSNENYFGQEITNEYDSGSQKAKDIANYLLNPATGAYTHPYIREGTKFAQGKQGLTETLSKATELPIRWYNTKSIQNAPFWEKYGNQKKVQEITTASSQGKIKPEDAIKKIEKLSGGNKIPDGMMVDMANGGVAYLSGNKIKFADTREEAELEVAKEEFRKSDQKIGEFGDYVLLKDKAGKVTPITRPEFDSKIRSQRLEIFKEQKNYTEWTKIANEQMTYLKAEYETADPLTQLEIENKIIDLQDQIDKYASYGGNFTKPKKAKSIKAIKVSDSTPKVSGVSIPTLKSTSPKINVKKVSINVPTAPKRTIKVARASKSRVSTKGKKLRIRTVS